MIMAHVFLEFHPQICWMGICLLGSSTPTAGGRVLSWGPNVGCLIPRPVRWCKDGDFNTGHHGWTCHESVVGHLPGCWTPFPAQHCFLGRPTGDGVADHQPWTEMRADSRCLIHIDVIIFNIFNPKQDIFNPILVWTYYGPSYQHLRIPELVIQKYTATHADQLKALNDKLDLEAQVANAVKSFGTQSQSPPLRVGLLFPPWEPMRRLIGEDRPHGMSARGFPAPPSALPTLRMETRY